MNNTNTKPMKTEKSFEEFMSLYQKENVTKQVKNIEESIKSLLEQINDKETQELQEGFTNAFNNLKKTLIKKNLYEII